VLPSQSEGNMDGCKMGATEAAPGHLKRGSKFHSTLMRDDFFVRIKPSAFVRDSSFISNGDAPWWALPPDCCNPSIMGLPIFSNGSLKRGS
jgi:hypothetical protein